jgi:hypothetical protein
LRNDPIYAESNFADIATSGDSLNQESGNENSDDFFINDQSNDIIDDKQIPKTSSDTNSKIAIVRLVAKMRNSVTGLAKLRQTYCTDEKFVKQIDAIIKELLAYIDKYRV